MSVLDEIGDYLVELGVVTEDNLFLGSRPDYPDVMVSIQVYPGGPPKYVQDNFLPSTEMVQIQVVARAPRYEDAVVLCERVWIALSPVTNQYLSGVKYQSIRPNNSPAIMARDTNDRMLIFFNASVEKEVAIGLLS